MRAILRKQFGGPDVLEIREMPEPEPKAGHAVIQVKAFGLNHAELHMRKGELFGSSANSSENQGVGFTEGAIGLSWHMLRQGAAQS
jgi:NADPH:quinone reductase-like Zn-dependent oxidoreductase